MAVPSEKFSRRNLIKTGGGGDYRNNNNDQGNQSKYVTSLRQFGQNLSCEKKFKQLISNLLQGFFWLEIFPPAAAGTGFPKIKVEPSSFSLNYEGTVPVFPAGGNGKLPSQSSLDTVYARKKMSQAERHRGWVKMRNVSSVKISIQVSTQWCWGHHL